MNDPGRNDSAENQHPRASGELRHLVDDDTGRYSVRTLTGGYVIDLTEGRLARYPVTAAVGTTSLTWTFDIDGTWLPIINLTRCAVGERMRAVVLIDGAEQPLHSSPVRTIQPLDAVS